MLCELSIHNYKSIRNVKLINLPSLCVFVGANAAGKSNFADAIDFLALVFKNGLPDAVRAKGGYENICFRRAKRAKAGIAFQLKAKLKPEENARFPIKKRGNYVFVFSYGFTFSTATQAITSEYEVKSESIKVSRSYNDLSEEELLSVEREGRQPIEVKGKGSRETDYFELNPNYLKKHLQEAGKFKDELLLTSGLKYYPPFYQLLNLLRSCGVYQISPYVARETGIPERLPELGRHGENLPAAVYYLRQSHPDAFSELMDHVNHTVPTITDVVTDYVETKQLGLYFKEKGVGRRWFSQDVSDGTIQTISIFLPLVDPRKHILFIEEPENSLHPWILRHFMDSCKQHSSDKQIFVTTQSIVAVNEVPMESLYTVQRDQGQTHIQRCIEVNPELTQVIKDWGRMSIVDTKPFILQFVWHSIFVHKQQELGIPV